MKDVKKVCNLLVRMGAKRINDVIIKQAQIMSQDIGDGVLLHLNQAVPGVYYNEENGTWIFQDTNTAWVSKCNIRAVLRSIPETAAYVKYIVEDKETLEHFFSFAKVSILFASVIEGLDDEGNPLAYEDPFCENPITRVIQHDNVYAFITDIEIGDIGLSILDSIKETVSNARRERVFTHFKELDKKSQEYAEFLLKIKAIKFQINSPFTWTNGWKFPFYCDNRMTLSFPDQRLFVKLQLMSILLNQFPEAEAVAGIAPDSIAHGSLVADALGLPFVYVRLKPKNHGLENLIEGKLKPGTKVVILEDLISTGSNSLNAVEAIRLNGCKVLGMVASFTYSFDIAKEAFNHACVKLVTLTNYDTVLDVALRMGYITDTQVSTLDTWHKDPAHWNP